MRKRTSLRFKRPEWMSRPIPSKLLTAFKKVEISEFENEELYEKYKKLEAEYLEEAAGDGLQQGILIVCLSRIRLGTLKSDFTYIGAR